MPGGQRLQDLVLHRVRPGDVGGVAAEVDPGVDENQFARLTGLALLGLAGLGSLRRLRYGQPVLELENTNDGVFGYTFTVPAPGDDLPENSVLTVTGLAGPNAVTYSGITFPQGDVAFADVKRYAEKYFARIPSGEPQEMETFEPDQPTVHPDRQPAVRRFSLGREPAKIRVVHHARWMADALQSPPDPGPEAAFRGEHRHLRVVGVEGMVQRRGVQHPNQVAPQLLQHRPRLRDRVGQLRGGGRHLL